MSDSLWLHESHQASLSITNSRSSLKIKGIKLVMPYSHLILCCLFLLLSPIPPSIRGFSNEYSGLISFKTDWFDLLAVQETQEPSSTAVGKYQFFMVQLSHPYMTTGKTIALTIWTFVSKVLSLLFNTLSRFVITFLPRSKSLLIS